MKTPRRALRNTQRTNENVALFLGPKLLGELRILMRLASTPRQAGAPEATEKSF